MALTRSTLTLIFVYIILFFALCAKPISSLGKEKFPTLSLPKLGVKKSSIDQNNNVIGHLEWLKQGLKGYIPWFADKKACAQTPAGAKPCCDQCQKNYGAALDCIKRSIESINKQDLRKAKRDISSIATNIQICYDCFVQTGNGEDKGVKEIYLWAKQAAEHGLDMLKTAENGVQK